MPVRKWGEERLVNTTFANDQRDPSVATLFNGNYVITWVDYSSDPDGVVRGQVYLPDGNFYGSQFTIAGPNGARNPMVVAGEEGGFVVSYDAIYSATDIDPAFVRFNSSGVLSATQEKFAGAVDLADQISVTAFNGNLYGVWRSPANNGDIAFGYAFGAAYPTGSIAFSSVDVVATGASIQARPAIAAFKAFGGTKLAVAWVDGSSVFTQLRRLDGGVDSVAAKVNIASGFSYDNPNVSALQGNRYIVSYTVEDYTFPESASGARARVFNDSGQAISGEIILNSRFFQGQSFPDIVGLRDGGFAAVWTDTSTNEWEIHGRVFDGNGAPRTQEFIVNTGSVYFESADVPNQMSVSELPDGRLIVVWEGRYSAGSDVSGHSVHSQIIDPRDGVVNGSAREDYLYGSDFFGDEINGFAGADTIFGLEGDDFLYGGDGADNMFGGRGRDVMGGGTGADQMNGQDGDDVYSVDNLSDIVRENAGGGADTIYSSANFTLPFNVETILIQEWAGAINATGNAQANGAYLYGNSSKNVLADGGGKVVMVGGAGDDVYSVTNAATVIGEYASGGTDTVYSTITQTLASSVETLILQGTAPNGTGNAGFNQLFGNASVNVLNGKGGADKLQGAGGNDTFVLARGEVQGDVIVDFTGAGVAGGDRISFAGWNPATTQITQLSATSWRVADGSVTEQFTLSNSAIINSGDWFFT